MFALIAVLPLLIFAWTLHMFDAMSRLQSQVSLALALATALLGFWAFRLLLGRTSELIRAVGNAVAAGAVAAHDPAAGRADQGEEARRRDRADPREQASHWTDEARSPFQVVPAIGRIQELDDIARTLGTLWKVEAAPHLGRGVLVSVMNRGQPIAGTLLEATDEGLLLEVERRHVAVSYRRISAIEPDRGC